MLGQQLGASFHKAIATAPFGVAPQLRSAHTLRTRGFIVVYVCVCVLVHTSPFRSNLFLLYVGRAQHFNDSLSLAKATRGSHSSFLLSFYPSLLEILLKYAISMYICMCVYILHLILAPRCCIIVVQQLKVKSWSMLFPVSQFFSLFIMLLHWW